MEFHLKWHFLNHLPRCSFIFQKNIEAISSKRHHSTIKGDLEIRHPQLSNYYELVVKSATNTLNPNVIFCFSLQNKDTFDLVRRAFKYEMYTDINIRPQTLLFNIRIRYFVKVSKGCI